MGVAEDAEAQLNEEDLLFQEDAVQAQAPRRVNKYLLRGALVLVALVSSVVTLGHVTRSTRPGASPNQASLVCGQTGNCPLWGLFFDPEVHKLVADNLVRAASPTLTSADLPMVRGLVEGSFRNISEALSKYAPEVAGELHVLKINATIKQYIAEAMDLVADPRVQGFGRDVAAAVHASPTDYRDAEDLKRHIATNLWDQLDEIQQFQLEEVSWRIKAIWSLGGRGSQWEMTLDVEAEAEGWQEAHGRQDPAAAPFTAANIGAGLAAVANGALAEGRTLLDLMLMCIRSKGSAWSTELHGVAKLFSAPLATKCDPKLALGQSADLGRALVCPLKFGMLGVDALRFSSTLKPYTPLQTGCGRRGRCSLHQLFSDHSVHRTVARSLVNLGAPVLGAMGMAQVTSLVGASFRGIGSLVQKRAPKLNAELNHLTARPTSRQPLLEAMLLAHNPQVQDLGRHVARALAAGRPYGSVEGLRRALEADLLKRSSSVRDLQELLVSDALRKIWRWGEDEQWQLTLAIERAEAAGGGGFAAASRRGGTSEERDAAIAGGALEEGRVLLDVMMMCVRHKGSAHHAELDGAEEGFVGPLATHCETEGAYASRADFRSAILCSLKFGLLGLDALRSSASSPAARRRPAAPAPSASGHRSEHRACTLLKACPLRDIFSDRTVQERAVADIIGAAADPSMLLGRSELPFVRKAVVAAFRNISEAVHEHAPAIDAKLGSVIVNHRVKQYIFEALQLMTDLHVQEIGRHIARTLRESSGSFSSPEELKAEVVRNLWKSFPEIQRLQATVERYAVRATWHAASAPQLELTFELEAQERRRVVAAAASPLLRQEEAIAQAAWQEGRALLDLALSFVHSGLRGAVGMLPPPPHVHCDPDVNIGLKVGFQSAMVCPLRFGIMGMDVLRFTDSIFTWTKVDARTCKDHGMCPLGRFFFDDYVHAAATADILRVAGEDVDTAKVEHAIDVAFRNVSVHIHLYASGVAENLAAEQAGTAEKEEFVSAMQLVGDPSVQAFGREVAAAVRMASGFSGRGDLAAQIVASLGSRRIEAMRNYTHTKVDKEVIELWRKGQDKQWEMTTDTEMVNALKTNAASTEQQVTSVETPSDQAAVLLSSALIEGRVLVDLLLMRVRGLTATSSSLFGAMDVFTPALAVPCPLEPLTDSRKNSLTNSIFCRLKFGALGIDALRFASTAPAALARPVGVTGGR